ncbi:MAG TPA: hypothetical protein VG736_09945 [Vicinamibacterales bacterium]|nr:hypothetical protein [Vicinamibacterales bacterium]
MAQAEVLRSRQNESPRPIIVVHRSLNVREQLRRVLDFVDDDAIAVLRQKSPRVAPNGLACIEGLEIDPGI